jgi:hypothetical protein
VSTTGKFCHLYGVHAIFLLWKQHSQPRPDQRQCARCCVSDIDRPSEESLNTAASPEKYPIFYRPSKISFASLLRLDPASTSSTTFVPLPPNPVMCILEEGDRWDFKPCIWFGNHRLCTRCLMAFQNINRRYQMPARVDFKHHQSHEELTKAATFRCAICLLLVERIKHLELKLRSSQDTSDSQPIYPITLNIDGGYTTLAAFLHVRNASGQVAGTLTFDIQDVEHSQSGRMNCCPNDSPKFLC